MEYQIALSPLAQKDLARISERHKDRLTAVLISLRHDPSLGKCLQGEFVAQHSYEVWPYRIIYEIIADDCTILVTRIKGIMNPGCDR